MIWLIIIYTWQMNLSRFFLRGMIFLPCTTTQGKTLPLEQNKHVGDRTV